MSQSGRFAVQLIVLRTPAPLPPALHCKTKETILHHMNTEERFVALETKIAYMEDFISKLQEEAVSNAKQIEILREENKILAGRYEELAENIDIPSRRPPHY